jgi:uncharacterized protein YoxC
MPTWLDSWVRFDKPTPAAIVSGVLGAPLRVSALMAGLRKKIGDRVREVNRMTESEVTEAAKHTSDVVIRARRYVEDTQKVLQQIDGRGQDGIGQLLGSQSELLRSHVSNMTSRAEAQDEQARQAARHAKSIGELAMSIDRLAGEVRLLAVNARIESARLGSQSAGFEVLASEMQRLSDEVASTNERVGDLAGRLGTDLPAIAQHAQELRKSMAEFAGEAAAKINDTESGVSVLQGYMLIVSQQGGAAMEDILRSSNSALSHLQFQDVVAQQLRQLDLWMHGSQVEVLHATGADSGVLGAVRGPEYQMEGDRISGEMIADSGEVSLF